MGGEYSPQSESVRNMERDQDSRRIDFVVQF